MTPPRRWTSWPLLTLPLGLVAVLVQLSPSLGETLQYDRAAVAAGQLYRWVTCHWTHWSWDHLLWDTTTFVVLGAICEHRSRTRLAVCILGSALMIPLGVRIILPGMQTYRGLSGIDSGLFVLLAVMLLGEKLSDRGWIWAGGIFLVLVAFCGKVLYELTTGSTIFVDSVATGMVPVPLAHVVGGAVGCATAVLPGRHGRR